MQEFRFQCPHCNQKYSVEEQYRGQEAVCENCKEVIILDNDIPFEEKSQIKQDPTIIISKQSGTEKNSDKKQRQTTSLVLAKTNGKNWKQILSLPLCVYVLLPITAIFFCFCLYIYLVMKSKQDDYYL